MNTITTAMKEGLARMYADEGCRAYILMEIRHQSENALKALDSTDPNKNEHAARYSQRAKAFQDILTRGQEFFTHYDKLRSAREGLVEKEKLQVEKY